MGRFLRGLLLGMGFALFIAPLRGQELRQRLSERLLSLRALLPNREQLPQPAQQAARQLQEAAITLQNGARQVATKVREQSPSITLPTLPTLPARPRPVAPPEPAPEAPSPLLQSPPPPSIPPAAQSQVPPAQLSVTPPAPAPSARIESSKIQEEDTGATMELPKQAAKNTGPLAEQSSTTTEQIESAPRKADPGSAPATDDQEPDLDMTPGAAGTTRVSAEISEQPDQATVSAVSSQSQPSEQGKALSTVPGVTPEILSKIEAEGIHTIPQLVKRASTKDERSELAQKISMGTNALRALVSRADLMQVHDIDADAATLLQEANVNGCKDLQRRNPENLLVTLSETQARKRLGGRIPSLDQLTAWIADAMSVTGSNEP